MPPHMNLKTPPGVSINDALFLYLFRIPFPSYFLILLFISIALEILILYTHEFGGIKDNLWLLISLKKMLIS